MISMKHEYEVSIGFSIDKASDRQFIIGQNSCYGWALEYSKTDGLIFGKLCEEMINLEYYL